MADFLAALKAELAKPAYAGKTDVEAAAILNAPSGPIVRPRGVVTTSALVRAFDRTEYGALTSVQLQRLMVLIVGGQVDLGDDSTVSILADIFPAGGPTRTALQALRTETIPRTLAQELFGMPVGLNDVATARSA